MNNVYDFTAGVFFARIFQNSSPKKLKNRGIFENSSNFCSKTQGMTSCLYSNNDVIRPKFPQKLKEFA